MPSVWLILGYGFTAGILALALWRARDDDSARRLPRMGVIAALMLVGMSVEIGVIGYHINLTVLAGILLGPWLGFIAAFIVNLILALFGHGGITVVGLNSLLLGSETILGWAFFRALKKRLDVRYAAAIAVILTLGLSTTFMIGIIALTQTQPALIFSGPSADAPLIHFELSSGSGEDPMSSLDLGRFSALVYLFGAIGWIIEAIFTAVVIGFFARARPELIETGAMVGTRAN